MILLPKPSQMLKKDFYFHEKFRHMKLGSVSLCSTKPTWPFLEKFCKICMTWTPRHEEFSKIWHEPNTWKLKCVSDVSQMVGASIYGVSIIMLRVSH